MSHSLEALLERIQTLCPDLKVEQVERNEEGLINDVVIVNTQWVFRFTKTEAYAQRLATELQILDLIRPQIGLSVPTPTKRGSDYVVYPLLPGQPLSRKLILAADEATQHHLAQQLGAFLYRLHTTDVSGLAEALPATRAPVRREDWQEIWAKVKAQIYPLFQKHQVEWAEDLFNTALSAPPATEAPALIHGDLASYHILLDAAAGQITGVLDFGMAGLGDVASDIGNLLSVYGEGFVQKMLPAYPTLARYMPRARFYAELLELEWVLRGLETGEAFWFTAHLGNARDLWA